MHSENNQPLFGYLTMSPMTRKPPISAIDAIVVDFSDTLSLLPQLLSKPHDLSSKLQTHFPEWVFPYFYLINQHNATTLLAGFSVIQDLYVLGDYSEHYIMGI